MYESTGLYVIGLETKYGACHVDRLYLCRSASGEWKSLSGYFDVAIQCKVSPEDDFKVAFTSGYYWTNKSVEVCLQKYDNNDGFVPFVGSYNLCRAYDNEVGSYYANCTSQRYMMCDFGHRTVLPYGYRNCIAERPQPTDKTTTLKSSTHSKTSSYTSSGTGDVLSPNTFNAIDVQSDQNENDLGLMVGLPVAMFVVLLVVATTLVIGCRRYRRHSNASKGNNSASGQMHSISYNVQLRTNNTPNETYNISTDGFVSGQLSSQHNETYNQTFDDIVEDEYAYIDDADDDGTDLHDQGEDGQYNTITDLKRQQNKASNDYDRIQINKAFDRYGANESELYDTSATNQRSSIHKSSDDYDHINVKRTEGVDVYDTTRPEISVNETTGNIYNQLDKRDKDDTYDKTSHQQTLLIRPVIDDETYT
ncbi:hypothetical protein ACF0H5_009801 [Mactra antiquata]